MSIVSLPSRPFSSERDYLAELVAKLGAVIPARIDDAPAEPWAALARAADVHLTRVALLLDGIRQIPEPVGPAVLIDRLLLAEVAAATAALRQITSLVRTDLLAALAVVDAAPRTDHVID